MDFGTPFIICAGAIFIELILILVHSQNCDGKLRTRRLKHANFLKIVNAKINTVTLETDKLRKKIRELNDSIDTRKDETA